MLQVATRYWQGLSPRERARFRFHHVSTDEVFGSLGPVGMFTETSPYQPNSPYAASKAGADHLVRAWHKTYGLPAVISNCSNNFGPYQFPEKFIPLLILKARDGEPLPVYGRGENIRDWLFVEDHAHALTLVLREGRIGDCYGIGGGNELRNIELAQMICDLLDEMIGPLPGGRPRRSLITFVSDRPGHDARYAIDASRAHHELKWQPPASVRHGTSENGRLVSGKRVVVGAIALDSDEAARAGRIGGKPTWRMRANPRWNAPQPLRSRPPSMS